MILLSLIILIQFLIYSVNTSSNGGANIGGQGIKSLEMLVLPSSPLWRTEYDAISFTEGRRSSVRSGVSNLGEFMMKFGRYAQTERSSPKSRQTLSKHLSSKSSRSTGCSKQSPQRLKLNFTLPSPKFIASTKFEQQGATPPLASVLRPTLTSPLVRQQQQPQFESPPFQSEDSPTLKKQHFRGSFGSVGQSSYTDTERDNDTLSEIDLPVFDLRKLSYQSLLKRCNYGYFQALHRETRRQLTQMITSANVSDLFIIDCLNVAIQSDNLNFIQRTYGDIYIPEYSIELIKYAINYNILPLAYYLTNNEEITLKSKIRLVRDLLPMHNFTDIKLIELLNLTKIDDDQVVSITEGSSNSIDFMSLQPWDKLSMFEESMIHNKSYEMKFFLLCIVPDITLRILFDRELSAIIREALLSFQERKLLIVSILIMELMQAQKFSLAFKFYSKLNIIPIEAITKRYVTNKRLPTNHIFERLLAYNQVIIKLQPLFAKSNPLIIPKQNVRKTKIKKIELTSNNAQDIRTLLAILDGRHASIYATDTMKRLDKILNCWEKFKSCFCCVCS